MIKHIVMWRLKDFAAGASREENAVKLKESLEALDGTAIGVVKDTGIGIAEEDLPLIFDRFYRVDRARSREQGGVGLGLSIGRWIAEAHGGTITVTSALERGSEFRVHLPRV